MLNSHTLWCKRACAEILSRKDDFAPLLLDILDEAIKDPAPFLSAERSDHIPAAYLLANMRVKEAYPKLVALLKFDEDDIEDLWGDILTQSYNWFLRDTYNGDISLLTELIKDRSIASWGRAMAILAYGMHYYDKHIKREDICLFFSYLIDDIYSDTKPDHYDEITVLSYVAICIREHKLEELTDYVKRLYAKEIIDIYMCETLDQYLGEWNHPYFTTEDTHIDDAVKELENWGWFKEHTEIDDDDEFDDDDFDDEDYDEFDEDYDDDDEENDDE